MKNKFIITGFTLLVVLLSVFFHIIAYIFFLLTLTTLIMKLLRMDLIYSFFISVAVSMVTIGLGSSIIAVFSKEYLFEISTLLYLVLGFFIFYKSLLGSKTLTIPKIEKSSFFGIILFAIMMTIFLYIPLHDRSIDGLLSLIASGEDNLSHFTIFNYVFNNNSTAYWQHDGIWRGIANYPQSTHIFSAYITHGVDQFFELSTLNLLRFYYLSISMISSLTIFFLVKSIGSIVKNNKINSRTILGLIASVLVFFIVTLNFIIGMHRIGYFAQIASLLFVVATFSVIARNNFKLNQNSLLLITFLISGSILSWYLASLLFVPLIMYLILKATNLKVRLLIITVFGLSLIPALLHVFVGNSQEAITQDSGDPFGINYIPFVLVSVITLIQAIRLKAHKKEPALFIYFSGSIGSVVLLGLLMLAVNGSVNYFFFKLCVLSTVIALLYFVHLSRAASSKVMLANICVIILLIYSFSIGIKPGIKDNFQQYTRDFAFLTHVSKSEVSDINPIVENNVTYDDAIYVNSCELIKQYIINRYIGSILLTQSDARRELEVYSIKQPLTLVEISKYTQKNPSKTVDVIYAKNCTN